MRLLIIIVGQLRSFTQRHGSLDDFINQMEEQGHDVDILVSTSEASVDFESWTHNSKIVHTIFLRQHAIKFKETLKHITNHHVYKNTQNSLCEGDKTIIPFTEQQNLRQFVECPQWFLLTLALRAVEQIELEVGYKYDIIMKSRFDYCYPAEFALMTKSTDYFDTITAGLEKQKDCLFRALEYHGLPKPTKRSYLNVLEGLTINASAGRLYHNRERDLNLGGRYNLNHDTLSKCDLSFDNIIYCFNDWCFWGKRDNMMRLADIGYLYGTFPAPVGNINFFFAPEYQLVHIAKQVGLNPIMFLNEHAGGIDRIAPGSLDINDNYFHDKYVYRWQGLRIVKTNSEYHITKCVDADHQCISLFSHYTVFGEVITIILETDLCSDDVRVTVDFSDENIKWNVETSTEASDTKHVGVVRATRTGRGRIALQLSRLKSGCSFKIKQFKLIRNKRPQIAACTFYSEGMSIDGVPSLDLSKEQSTFKQAMSPQISLYKALSYSCINKLDARMVQNFNVDNMHNPGAGYTGFFRWKPYIMLHTIRGMNYGDILVYRDCNVTKYPQYLTGKTRLEDNLHYVLGKNDTDIYIPIEKPGLFCCHHVKREVFDHFGQTCFDEWKHEPLLNASMIIVRKTRFTLQFLREWLELCMINNLIDDVNYVKQCPNYMYTTYDQAVLNMLVMKYKKEGKLPKTFPIFYHQGRIFDKDHIRALQTVQTKVISTERRFIQKYMKVSYR
jgi:hypothetical protein